MFLGHEHDGRDLDVDPKEGKIVGENRRKVPPAFNVKDPETQRRR